MSMEIVKIIISKAKINKSGLDRLPVESFFILVELVVLSLLGLKMHFGVV